MELVAEKITLDQIIGMSKKIHGQQIKAVVDIEKGIMVVDASMHANQECYLLEELESKQGNLWGINLHPQHFGTKDWIEFDSMINMRPTWGNSSRGVDSKVIQDKIIKLVNMLVVAS